LPSRVLFTLHGEVLFEAILEVLWSRSHKAADIEYQSDTPVARQLDLADPAFAASQFFALLKAFAFWPQIIGVQPPPSSGEREALIESAVSMFLARYQA
jgi:hypothetical protein